MFWLQASVSFAVWILYGVLFVRRSIRGSRAPVRSSRRAPAVAGPALLLGSVGVLALGAWGVHSAGGIGPDGMGAAAWAVATIAGAGFVHMQAAAALALAGLARDAVTSQKAPASISRDPQSEERSSCADS